MLFAYINSIQWGDSIKAFLIGVAAVLLLFFIFRLIDIIKYKPNRVVGPGANKNQTGTASETNEAGPEASQISFEETAASGEKEETDGEHPEKGFAQAPAYVSCTLSFMAKLLESDSVTKARYNAVKNELLRYGFSSKITFKAEVFRAGRETVARLCMTGKAIAIYLALDPADYQGSKYRFRDSSAVKRFASTPLCMRLTSERAVKHTAELIADLGRAHGRARSDSADVNHLPEFGKLVKKTRISK